MRRLEQERRIPVLPVYVDSPMANEALKFYSARIVRARRGHAADARRRSRRSRRRAFRPSRRRSSRRSSPPAGNRRSSSRRAAWRPAGACCTTWRPRSRTRATRCSSSATRPPAPAAVSSSTARARSGFTDSRSPVQRAHREDRLDVGARRSRRDPPLARHAARQAGASVSRARRAAPMDALKTLVQQRLGWDADTPQHLERLHL